MIKVDAPTSMLHPLEFADSNSVEVGDGVVAIGSPFGLEETITAGIVSALHRQMTSPNNFTIDDSIQTDAAINHGNSGGPLLNMQGKVIGINSQIESDSGGNDGVGFAVPSNTARSIANRLVSTGKVEHAYFGVSLQTAANGARLAVHQRRHSGGESRAEGRRRDHFLRRQEGRLGQRAALCGGRKAPRPDRDGDVPPRREDANGVGHARGAPGRRPYLLDDSAANFAERLAAEHDLVAVLQERAFVPRELDQAAALSLAGA